MAFNDTISIRADAAVNPHPNPLPVGEGSLATVGMVNDLGAYAPESQNRKPRFWFSYFNAVVIDLEIGTFVP